MFQSRILLRRSRRSPGDDLKEKPRNRPDVKLRSETPGAGHTLSVGGEAFGIHLATSGNTMAKPEQASVANDRPLRQSNPVAGKRDASRRIFSECYLETPVENGFNATSARPADRNTIFEATTLANPSEH